jgi:uncharacterized protein
VSDFLNKIYNGNLEWLSANTIFLTYYGSRAYGLSTPESDVDIRGIAIPPKRYWLGHVHRFEQAELKGDVDCVIYNISKFFKLAADGNPSIIEQLYTDESDFICTTTAGKMIIDNRDLFLSKKIKYTFCGYSHSQLQRLKAHRRWVLQEGDIHKPTRAEFSLPEQAVLSADIRGAIDKMTEEDVGITFSGNVMELFKKEREYAAACREYANYETWVKNRNPKRAAIERRIGFDGKHASQLIRLMIMAAEILSTGKVIVKRPPEDREWLVGLKTGNTDWRYETMMEWVEKKSAEIEELVKTSTLPNKPDHEKIDDMLIEIVEAYI